VALRTLDADRLAAICTRHLGGSVTIDGLRRLSGGASRESWSFDAVSDGGTRQGLVLRRDPGSTVGSTDRSTEYRLLEAAAGAGVPVPTVRFLLEPDDDVGDGFVMDRIDGETIPRRILRDDEFAGARDVIVAQLGTIAAQIHAVDLATLPKMPTLGALDQIEQYRGLLDLMGEPHPAFELGLRWLEDHAGVDGESTEPRLVHGDFRNGNFIVGPEGLRAVLDWELAHLGDPLDDLGWYTAPLYAREHLIPGSWSCEDLLRRYTERTGIEVDSAALHFWQVLSTFRLAVIALTGIRAFVEGGSDRPAAPATGVIQQVLAGVLAGKE
jgi:aminoglycoside phosphotransferase (APT) family kinase protein